MIPSPLTRISFVVLNWNREKDTDECLESISRLDTTGFTLNLIVVDNNSSEKSLSEIKRKLKNVLNKTNIVGEIIENKENYGFAKGNNIGIQHALNLGTDYILVLNNDVILSRNFLTNLMKSVYKVENFGIASPKIYFEKGFEFNKKGYRNEDLGKVIWYAGGSIDWDNVYGSTRGVDEVDRGQYNKMEETDFATGTCMLISRELIEKVGLFNESYYMYYEDTDFSVRTKKAGLRVMYIPSAIIWHKVAQSSGIGSGLNDYFTTRNRMLFGLKYARLRTKLALIRESVRLLINGRKWQKIGIRDFYLGKFGKGSWV